MRATGGLLGFVLGIRYAGPKINRARAKYGPSNFVYEILHRKYYFNKVDATYELDKWEIYYIGYYDSYINGYNSTIGGLSNRGIVRSELTKAKMRLANLGRKQSPEEIEKRANSIRGTKHSIAATINSKNLRRSSGRLNIVYQYNLEGVLLRTWRCAAEVSESLNINIKNICRAIKTLGIYKGYYWRDSSTFINKRIWNNSKTVYQKDKTGKLIATFKSVKEAASSINKQPTLISRCLNGKRDSAYDFI